MEKKAGNFEFRTSGNNNNILTYIYNEIIMPDKKMPISSGGNSDEKSFEKSGIPAFMLGQIKHDYYIQALENDLEYIDANYLKEVAEIVLTFIEEFDLSKYDQIK